MLPSTVKTVPGTNEIIDLKLHESQGLVKTMKKTQLIGINQLDERVEVLAFNIKKTTCIALVKYLGGDPFMYKLHSQSAKPLAEGSQKDPDKFGFVFPNEGIFLNKTDQSRYGHSIWDVFLGGDKVISSRL